MVSAGYGLWCSTSSWSSSLCIWRPWKSLSDFDHVDVAADHAIAAAPPRLFGHDMLEVGHEVDRVLGLVLQVLRHRPVRKIQASADDIEPAVEYQQQSVDPVAEVHEPAHALHHRIEEIAMHHPQPLVVRRYMDGVLGHGDFAQVQADELARSFVVIAWDIDDFGALACRLYAIPTAA